MNLYNLVNLPTEVVYYVQEAAFRGDEDLGDLSCLLL